MLHHNLGMPFYSVNRCAQFVCYIRDKSVPCLHRLLHLDCRLLHLRDTFLVAGHVDGGADNDLDPIENPRNDLDFNWKARLVFPVNHRFNDFPILQFINQFDVIIHNNKHILKQFSYVCAYKLIGTISGEFQKPVIAIADTAMSVIPDNTFLAVI